MGPYNYTRCLDVVRMAHTVKDSDKRGNFCQGFFLKWPKERRCGETVGASPCPFGALRRVLDSRRAAWYNTDVQERCAGMRAFTWEKAACHENGPGTIFSNLGIPALTLPCGIAENGLPLGLQLASAPFTEARLLAVARWCERTLAFTVRPTLVEEALA